MKKKIISCLMVVIIVILAYFYAHIDKNSYIYDRNVDTGTFYGTGILEDGDEIRQTFVADEDTIDGINLKVTTSGMTEDIVLCYSLLDEDSELIYTGTMHIGELKNNKFNELEIQPVKNTKGKQYTIVLSTENSNVQNGIGVYIEPVVHDNQQLIVNEEKTEGTLVARIICHRFDVETFIVVMAMVTFVMVFMKALFKLFK